MRNSQLFLDGSRLLVSATLFTAVASSHASNIYTDGAVNFELPGKAVPLERQDCGKDAVTKVPASLTGFQCKKVLHGNNVYLILKNTASKSKRYWQYKVFDLGERAVEMGDVQADYDVLPVLIDGKRLEFLAVNAESLPVSNKTKRSATYERYKPDGKSQPSLTLVGGTEQSAKINAGGSESQSQGSATQGMAQGKDMALADSGGVPPIHSSVTAPRGAPSNDVVRNAVISELQNNVPGRWIKLMIPGQKAKFRVIEIIKWGKVTSIKPGSNVYPVRVRVAGSATGMPPFGSPMPGTFDEIAEFRFVENDFGEWEHKFDRPSVF